MARRPALYSLYSTERKVGLPRSKAAMANSGREARTIASIDVKPYTALVTRPSDVLIGGRGEKAREVRLWGASEITRPRPPLGTVEVHVRKRLTLRVPARCTTS